MRRAERPHRTTNEPNANEPNVGLPARWRKYSVAARRGWISISCAHAWPHPGGCGSEAYLMGLAPVHTHTCTYTCAQFRSKWSGVGPQGWRTSGVEWDPRGGELVGRSGIPGVEGSGTPGVVVDPSLTLRDV